MKIHVRYMAQLRREVGLADETFDLSPGGTLRDLLTVLVERHGPPLERSTALVFVNDAQADRSERTPLKDGDRVTFLSPIAGG